MKTITINTAELSGAALDWAVAVAVCKRPVDRAGYSPSTDWSQGGPLIERHDVWLSSEAIPGPWLASINGCGLETGPTPLIAACRAIVYRVLGDTVAVPAEMAEALA